jgi:hypothetical protein
MKKSGGFTESLRFTESSRFKKNWADLQNPCVLQKNRQTIESLRALKFPRLVKKPAGLEKTGDPLTV